LASRGDFNLNNFEDGVLSSAFMVGLLVASPIFASLAKMLVLCLFPVQYIVIFGVPLLSLVLWVIALVLTPRHLKYTFIKL
jgi:MFS transporter, Spinster family, sphingosine-1-phosphate transporter